MGSHQIVTYKAFILMLMKHYKICAFCVNHNYKTTVIAEPYENKQTIIALNTRNLNPKCIILNIYN